jgi:hypothetical protein
MEFGWEIEINDNPDYIRTTCGEARVDVRREVIRLPKIAIDKKPHLLYHARIKVVNYHFIHAVWQPPDDVGGT